MRMNTGYWYLHKIGKYKRPWSRQKKLQQEYSADEVPNIDELVDIINNIRVGKRDPYRQTLQARALFAMYYLTACRLSEIIKVVSLRKGMRDDKGKFITEKRGGKRLAIIEIVPHHYIGIQKKHIVFDELDGKRCMFIRTENRKHKTRHTKRQPIPIELEEPIVDFVEQYLDYIDVNETLFPFGIKRATQIITQTTGFNIHFIRHIRCTHLVTKYDFNEQLLVRFMGWTDARPAKNYMELRVRDVFRQFYKTLN